MIVTKLGSAMPRAGVLIHLIHAALLRPCLLVQGQQARGHRHDVGTGAVYQHAAAAGRRVGLARRHAVEVQTLVLLLLRCLAPGVCVGLRPGAPSTLGGHRRQLGQHHGGLRGTKLVGAGGLLRRGVKG